MKKEATIMAMPVRINVIDKEVKDHDFEDVFAHIRQMDERFSTFKSTSETERFNRGEISEANLSDEMKNVLFVCGKTKQETNGYFDAFAGGKFDPAGIVKCLAIYEGSKMLEQKGFPNFYFEIAGDIQANGANKQGKKWQIGIENPFDRSEIIKVVELSNRGIATSGTYIRGQHIWDPIGHKKADEIMSITVIGPNVLEADRFATAAFAMGEAGIQFLESQKDLEGFMVTKDKNAIGTTGFAKYLARRK